MRKSIAYIYLPCLLVASTLLAAIISLSLGSVHIPLHDLLHIGQASSIYHDIVLNIRAPRILMAVLVGMMLGSSGVVVQAVFGNPLADPYIIGIAASATFGAVIAYIFSMPDIYYGIFAFFTCIASTLVIFAISSKEGQVDVTMLLIVGIALSAFIAAFTSFAMYLIGEQSFRISMWLMGYLGAATWNKVALLAIPLLFALVFFYASRHTLDALLCGDLAAHGLGVNVGRVKLVMLSVSALIVAFSVAFAGMIGFVGLIVPHAIRMVLGPSNAQLVVNAALLGGLFLLLCDTFGRLVIAPTEIPIGVLTALFGAPFFLYLAWKSRGRGAS